MAATEQNLEYRKAPQNNKKGLISSGAGVIKYKYK